MSGFIAAPPSNPEVGFEGQPRLRIPKTGLVIVPGVGIAGRTDTAGSRLLLDASRTSFPETFSLYRPGAVAAGELGRWANHRPSPVGLVSKIEANLGVAPTAGDASNHWAVQITEPGGNSGLLPISTAGVRHYSLNRGDGVETARPYNAQSGGSPSVLDSRAIVLGFTPTQALNVTGLRIHLVATDPGTGAHYAAAVRLVILNSAGAVLGTAESATVAEAAGVSGSGRCVVGFAMPTVTLPANVPYFFGIELVGAKAPSGAAGTLGTYTFGSSVAAQPISVGQRAFLPSSSLLGVQDWSDALNARAGWSALRNRVSAGDDWPWALLGSGGAITTRGTITVSVVAIGTPPAGADGSDLNVSLLIGTA